jgi:hypothetical protein
LTGIGYVCFYMADYNVVHMFLIVKTKMTLKALPYGSML